MERPGAVLVMVSLMLVSGCGTEVARLAPGSSQEPVAASAAAAKQGAADLASAASGAAAPDVERIERKIIRTAHVEIETGDVADAERRAIAIVEELGGFVASSDRSARTNDEESASPGVEMVLRVPSDRFTDALGRLEKLGSRVLEERVSSSDVSEEFIDLKARIGAQRALEQQFLEILKQAKSVKDALEVSTHLADVRTALEKLEGRQRFLENQTSISTIKLRIGHGAPLVRVGRFAFGDSVARAGADVLNISAAIVHGAIRAFGVLAPIFALVFMPGALLARALFRRRRRQLAGA